MADLGQHFSKNVINFLVNVIFYKIILVDRLGNLVDFTMLGKSRTITAAKQIANTMTGG